MKHQKIASILVISTPLLLASCLKTRGDVKEYETTRVQQQQVIAMQKAEQQENNEELQEQLRNMNGRLEVLENKTENSDSDKEKKQLQETIVEQNKKLAIMQDALSKMENQVFNMSADIQALKTMQASSVAAAPAAGAPVALPNAKKGGHFELGFQLYKEKEWKRAILAFQKYRDENPSGKRLGQATLLIAQSFEELGMKDEAKTFYEEVVQKHPNSSEAKIAKSKLKVHRK